VPLGLVAPKPISHYLEMMRKLLFSIVTIAFLFSCSNLAMERKEKSPLALDINVSETLVRPIPPRFVGLSFEASVLNGPLFKSHSFETFKNLLRNLGPGVLRFGGFAVDKISWETSSPGCKEKSVINKNDLESMFSFATEVDWRVILGLNLGCGSVIQAVDEARFAESVGEKSLIAFEIGNEPNFFAGEKLRPNTYNPRSFIAEFNRYQSAIKTVLPGANLSGPGAAGLQRSWDWYTSFLQAEDKITFATQHAYPMVNSSEAKGTSRFPSIENMLGEENRKNVLTLSKKYTQFASAHNLPLRMTETNSVGGGGAKGVSDVYASALWAAEHLFTLLEAGLVGADFHGEPDADFNQDIYSPIKKENGIYTAQPEYYGLLFFTQAAQGELVHLSSESSEAVKYYAFKDTPNTLRIAVLNMGNQKAELKFHLANKYRITSLMRLSGNSVAARDGIHFGNAIIGSDGIWNPKGDAPEVSATDSLLEQVEPYSGILIVLKQ
jgi:hypothetical protein